MKTTYKGLPVSEAIEEELIKRGGIKVESGAIMFFNTKGGVNKSSLVEYLVRYYGFYGAEFDSKGVLAGRCNKEGEEPLVQYVDVESDFTLPEDKTFAFDMGGYDDYRLPALLRQASLLVVPYSVAEPDVEVTEAMIEDLFDLHREGEIDLALTPIIFCPTMYDSKLKSRIRKVNESMEKIFNMMPEGIQIDFFPMPYSNAMVMSRDYNVSIWDLYAEKAPMKKYGVVSTRHYKKDAELYDNFVKKIQEYM